jgi:hypothetical protein
LFRRASIFGVSGASLAYQEIDTILKKVHIDGGRSQSLSEEDSQQIQRVIEENPQLAKCHFQFHYGSYVCWRRKYIKAFPLFHLCQAFDGSNINVPVSLIQAVYHAYPRALTTLDSTGLSLIHRLCGSLIDDGSQENLLEILAFFAHECPRAFGQGRDSTPLHWLCHMAQQKRMGLVLIRLVTETYPEALKRKQRFSKELPLHRACSLHDYVNFHPPSLASWMQVVDFLIQRYPKAAYAKDSEGKLPLHSACINPHHTIIERLIHAYPDALRVQTKSGDLPLHVACYCRGRNMRETTESVKLIVKSCPDALKIETKWGITPLKRAQMQQGPKELLELLQPHS